MVKKIVIKDGKIPNIEENVACIGYFDGVHIGHQKLIRKTIDEANRLGLMPTLICFNPDPIDIISGNKNKHLLSYKDRLNVIEYFGIEQIIIINFNKKIMNIDALDFIHNYLEKMNIREIVCGFDYTFGYKALGNSKLLKKNFNGKTIVIDECCYYGKKVSTTRIKQALLEGNFKLMNRLIGWEYCLSLKVDKCSNKGKKWLIEAISKDKDCLLPKEGKYGKYFEVKDDRVILIGPSKLEKGQDLLISFESYE